MKKETLGMDEWIYEEGLRHISVQNNLAGVGIVGQQDKLVQ